MADHAPQQHYRAELSDDRSVRVLGKFRRMDRGNAKHFKRQLYSADSLAAFRLPATP